MKKYISYLRVSTQKQEKSGLGLEAQRQIIAEYLNGEPPIAEYQEIETGTAKRKRVKIYEAIQQCRDEGAILIVAKLDRLARDVQFITSVLNSGIEVVFADFPQANKFTLTILAAVAEYEAKLISDRTKAALSVKKQQGIKLGNPNIKEAQKKATEASVLARKSQPIDGQDFQVKSLVYTLRGQGLTNLEIASKLNTKFRGGRGAKFTSVRVSQIYSDVTNSQQMASH